jgi:hypothetical protein
VDGRHGAAGTEHIVHLAPARIVALDGPLTPEILKMTDVIHLNYVGAPIPEGDVAAIQRFVSEGGGLFIVALGWSLHSYGHVVPEKNPLNTLCRPFGFYFNADYAKGEQVVKDPRLPGGTGFLYSAKSMPYPQLLPHVKAVYSWGVPSSITVSSPGFVIVACDQPRRDHAIATGCRFGKGRVVAMQPSGFYDPSIWQDNASVDNRASMSDVFAWLFGPATASAVDKKR